MITAKKLATLYMSCGVSGPTSNTTAAYANEFLPLADGPDASDVLSRVACLILDSK